MQNTSQINQKKTASFEESVKAKEPSSVESVKVNAPSFEENVKRETPKTSILKKRTIYTPETKEELRKMVSDNSISLKDIDISKVNDLSKLFAAVKGIISLVLNSGTCPMLLIPALCSLIRPALMRTYPSGNSQNFRRLKECSMEQKL